MSVLRGSLGWTFGVLMAVLISACGGGNGGGGTGPEPEPTSSDVQGVVTDPPIANAQVRLVDADGNALATVRLTDASGAFTFDDIPNSALSGAFIFSLGGNDALTGYDFFGIELAAALTGEEEGIVVVSPLTSLVVAEMKAGDIGRDEALERIAERLGLTEQEVLADPATSPGTQRAALKLTRLAEVLRDAGTPIARITAALGAAEDLDAALTALQTDSGLSESVRDRLAALAGQFADIDAVDAATSAEMIAAANRIAWRHGVARYAEEALGLSTGDETTALNLQALADTIWEANDRRGVPSFGMQPRNLVRYVLRAYDIPAGDLALADFTELRSEALAALAGDAQVAPLAALAVVDHRIPLAASETLGNDNAARLAYYYASDLSPAYRAEQVLSDVFDDTVLDPVYVSVVEEIAAAGRLEEAGIILNTRIWQPTQRAQGTRRIGNALAARGEVEDAGEWWEAALEAYNATIDAKGLDNLDGNDAAFYQALRTSARDSGFEQLAEDAVTKVSGYLEKQEEYNTAYGRVLTAVRSMAIDAVGDAVDSGLSPEAVAEARAIVDWFVEFLEVSPPQAGTNLAPCTAADLHYTLKGLYLTNAADYYLQLGLLEDAWNAVGLFNDVRALDTCNAYRTRTYVRNVVPVYGAMGLIDEYISMANATITVESVRIQAVGAAELYLAYEQARDGEVEEAIARIVTANPTNLSARLSLLSWDGVNRGAPGLALLLFESGDDEAAEQVMEVAWELALSEDYLTAYTGGVNAEHTGVRSGCAKLASGYYDFVSAGEGRTRMQSCADAVLAHYDGSGAASMSNRVGARTYLAEFQAYVGLDEAAEASIAEGGALAALITDDAGQRSRHRRLLADGAANIGKFEPSFDILAAELVDYVGDFENAADENVRRTVIVDALRTVWSLTRLTDRIGARAVREGDISAANRALVADARGLARSFVHNGGEGIVGDIAQLASPEDRAGLYKDNEQGDPGAVSLLALARSYDVAETVARLEGHTLPDRMELLQSIAEIIIAEDDFGGAARLVARRDLDGDGKPDLFAATATAEQIAATALVLDDDIDGDGIPDTLDGTPFCASCGG